MSHSLFICCCQRFFRSCVAAGFLLIFANARAVIVSGSDSQYTSAPADDFGFENVAQVFDSADGFFTSGVYLGGGWMLSAYHEVRDGSGGFEFGSVYLDGTQYSVNAGTAVRLKNSDDTFADLALYQLTTTPSGIGALALSSAALPANAGLTLMGNGVDRAATLTNWNVNTHANPWTWTQTGGAGNYHGYQLLSTQTLRWGTNVLSGTGSGDDGYGVTSYIYTVFSGTSGNAQAEGGDSGGGVFFKSGSNWELAGIILGIGTYSGQPSNTAVFGDDTFAADISQYSGQINAVIPEPSPRALLLLGALAFVAGRFWFWKKAG
jgi:hypothetical protein